MEIRKNEIKEELQGFKHRVYGMDGVGKQTDSISCSLKRCVIKRVVDGKGNMDYLESINQEDPKKKGKAAPIY